MLEISQPARKRLELSGALDFDDAGEEVLLGLTLPESQFLLICIQQPSHKLDPGDDFLCQQLQMRHVKARVDRVFPGDCLPAKYNCSNR